MLKHKNNIYDSNVLHKREADLKKKQIILPNV